MLRWVSPFRYLRIVGYLLLPEAFRSLSRLSSALSAKASTICSFLHDQLTRGNGIVPLILTGIALPALAIGQLFYFVFFEVNVIINLVVNNNYLGCLELDINIFIIYFLYAVFKVHVD